MKSGSGSALLLAATIVPASATLAHSDHVDQAAWNACEPATLADACVYTDYEENVYRGLCRSMSNTLLCVRNQPIEPRDEPGTNFDP